jgi:hypothetical protein
MLADGASAFAGEMLPSQSALIARIVLKNLVIVIYAVSGSKKYTSQTLWRGEVYRWN